MGASLGCCLGEPTDSETHIDYFSESDEVLSLPASLTPRTPPSMTAEMEGSVRQLVNAPAPVGYAPVVAVSLARQFIQVPAVVACGHLAAAPVAVAPGGAVSVSVEALAEASQDRSVPVPVEVVAEADEARPLPTLLTTRAPRPMATKAEKGPRVLNAQPLSDPSPAPLVTRRAPPPLDDHISQAMAPALAPAPQEFNKCPPPPEELNYVMLPLVCVDDDLT
mmetsp:Transcript_56778/g.164717  ORF Transcript_56778/g.164717 Transcript_56778/m.164717 type:complete len:222 (+) Transcript_56778:89-754(+)